MKSRRTCLLVCFSALILSSLSNSLPAAEIAVKIREIGNRFVFDPTNIVINAGDSVIWTNSGPSPHDTTHNPSSGARLWTSGLLAVGKKFTNTFNQAGYYPYICAVHIAMHPEQTGTVTVASTTLPPSVALVNPTNNARFFAPATIDLEATASSNDGIAQVEFFAGAKSVGKVTAMPYKFVASELAAGNYALTAVATGIKGLSTTSAVVSVTVTTPPAVQLVNLGSLLSGEFQLTASRGEAGQTCYIEASSDLVRWTRIATNIFPPNLCPICPAFNFTDTQAPSFPHRFYRAQIAP